MIELTAWQIALILVPAVLPHLRALVNKTPSDVDNQVLSVALQVWDVVAGNYGAAKNQDKKNV